MANKDVNKKYDLEIKRKEVKGVSKPFIFVDSSSSDDESNKIPTLSFSSNFKKQDTSKFEKALQEDPTIYDYDSVYDQISTAGTKNTKPEEKHRPKLAKIFIENAEKKNMRQQIVFSKKAKRENEVDKKEVFVTSAYKKEHQKLLEMDREDRLQEEKEKNDNTKQTDRLALYSYLLDQKLNSHSKPTDEKESDEQIGKKVETEAAQTAAEEPVQDNNSEENEIVKQAMKAKMVRDKALKFLQKPSTDYMVARFAKKNDDLSIQNAKERYLNRKRGVKRAVVEDDDSD